MEYYNNRYVLASYELGTLYIFIFLLMFSGLTLYFSFLR
jgi:hypothetical protein